MKRIMRLKAIIHVVIFMFYVALPKITFASEYETVKLSTDKNVLGGDYRQEYYDSLILSFHEYNSGVIDTDDYDFEPDVFGFFTKNESGDFVIQPKYAALGESYRRMDLMIDNVSSQQRDGVLLLSGRSRVDGTKRLLSGHLSILDILYNPISCDSVFDPIKIISELDLLEYADTEILAEYNGIYSVNALLDPHSKIIHLDASMFLADGYENRTFVGVRKDLLNQDRYEKCLWGDYRLPFCEDFNYGAGEKYYNPKYIKNGWIDLYPIVCAGYVEFSDYGLELLNPELYDNTPLYSGTTIEDSIMEGNCQNNDVICYIDPGAIKYDDCIFLTEFIVKAAHFNNQFDNVRPENVLAFENSLTITIEYVKEVAPAFFVVSGLTDGDGCRMVGNIQIISITDLSDSGNQGAKICDLHAIFCLYIHSVTDIYTVPSRIDGTIDRKVFIKDGTVFNGTTDNPLLLESNTIARYKHPGEILE